MNKRVIGLLSIILLMPVATLGVAAAEGPEAPVRLVAVAPVTTASGTALEVRLSGPFTYTAYQPDGRNVVVDLAGVVSESLISPDADGIAWLNNIRLLPFRNAGGNQVLRLDVSLKDECQVDVSQSSRSVLSILCKQLESVVAEEVEDTAPVAESSPLERPVTPTPVATAGPVAVRKVRVDSADRKLMVWIDTAAPVAYETLSLQKPNRLVVDVPGGILSGRSRKLAVSSPWVESVRVAQFKANPPVTRVVLDLKTAVPHRIEATPSGLRVVLGEEQRAQAETPARAVPAKKTAPSPEEVAALVERESAELPAQPAPRRTIDPVQVASLAPMIPGVSAVNRDVSDRPVPVPTASSGAAKPAAITMNSSSSPAPDRTTPVEPVPVFQEATATAASEQSMFTGEPISVNLKDIELKEFFRLIHEISGLNVVLDPNVSGTVTLIMVEVPWDQILDIVLRNNGLDKTLEGNVLRIASRSTLKQESEEQRDLAQARAEAVDPITVTRRINYARAQDMEPTLNRFLSSRGQLMRDDRTNTIIVRDIPSVLPAIDDLIRQLDRKSQQVEIEARVVTARRNFARDIGSQIATASGTRNRRHLWGGGQGGEGFIERTIPPLPPVIAEDSEGKLPSATDLGAVGATSGIFYHHASPNFGIDVVLTAAETRGIAKVLSRPRVITQNNITALVKQGASIPVQTEINNTISTQFIDAVLSLQVTPQITGDGNVFLNIQIKNDRADFGNTVNGVPSIVTQEANTQVLVNDGGTVVVGGVLVTDNSTTIDQVPLLGSIPIIGHLFKRTAVRTSTEELLFFITPRILPD